MKFIENQLQRWFGMNLHSAGQIIIIGFFTLLIAITVIFAIISLINNPSAASDASWGFAG